MSTGNTNVPGRSLDPQTGATPTGEAIIRIILFGVAFSVVSAGRNRETEVKIQIGDPRALRRQLKQLGFALIHPKALEDNVLFDTPDRALRQVRSLLRLRRYGSRWTVTYKGTPENDRYFKSRVELESQLENPAAIRAIFLTLGLVPVFRYQKYRAEYALFANRRRKPFLLLALDETPIGNYMELESSRAAIDRVAGELGYSRADYNTASYGALYLEDCRRKKKKPSNMIFTPALGHSDSPGKGSRRTS